MSYNKWLLYAIPIFQAFLIAIFARFLTSQLTTILILICFFLATLMVVIFVLRQQILLNKIGLIKFDYSLHCGMSVKECIDTTTCSLSFMGISGRKWKQEQEAMEKMLQRILLHHGNVRFLLLDPDCEAAKQFTSMKKNNHEDFRNDLDRLISYLREKKRHGSLVEVRLYDSLPNWRITIIDNNTAIASPYALPSPDGMEAPQLIFGGTSEWSYAHCLKATFKNEWSRAKIAL